jgi:hypothetical protein
VTSIGNSNPFLEGARIRAPSVLSSLEGGGIMRCFLSRLLAVIALTPSSGASVREPVASKPLLSDGMVFLATEHYYFAELCLGRVIREFPACHEAEALLGHAQLMRYCDNLTTEDLAPYLLGQLATGGFRRRLPFLEPPVRGKDRRLWWRALESLDGARRQGRSARVLADLGLAHLVAPDGREMKEALTFLEAAVRAAAEDTSFDLVERARLFINLGVAYLSEGQNTEGLKWLDRAEAIMRKLVGPGRSAVRDLTDALLYNRAMLLASAPDRPSRERAADALQTYLRSANPLSAWWPLAFDRYASLCKEQRRKAASRDELSKARPESLRPAPVRLAPDLELMPGVEVRSVLGRLGPCREIPTLVRTNLRRLCFEKYPVEVLVTDVVLAVCISGPGAPPVLLRGRSSKDVELRVGMTVEEMDRVLGHNYRTCALASAGLFFRCYPEEGVAVRLVGGKVVEVIVVQVFRG